MNTITLTVTDDDGGAGSAVYQFVVVYDPDGGFASGAGRFIPTKEAGDVLPGLEPNNTSPAMFGFAVKYNPGATTPEGRLQFQYRQGRFNLQSGGMD